MLSLCLYYNVCVLCCIVQPLKVAINVITSVGAHECTIFMSQDLGSLCVALNFKMKVLQLENWNGLINGFSFTVHEMDTLLKYLEFAVGITLIVGTYKHSTVNNHHQYEPKPFWLCTLFCLKTFNFWKKLAGWNWGQCHNRIWA